MSNFQGLVKMLVEVRDTYPTLPHTYTQTHSHKENRNTMDNGVVLKILFLQFMISSIRSIR